MKCFGIVLLVFLAGKTHGEAIIRNSTAAATTLSAARTQSSTSMTGRQQPVNSSSRSTNVTVRVNTRSIPTRNATLPRRTLAPAILQAMLSRALSVRMQQTSKAVSFTNTTTRVTTAGRSTKNTTNPISGTLRSPPSPTAVTTSSSKPLVTGYGRRQVPTANSLAFRPPPPIVVRSASTTVKTASTKGVQRAQADSTLVKPSTTTPAD